MAKTWQSRFVKHFSSIVKHLVGPQNRNFLQKVELLERVGDVNNKTNARPS